MLVGFIEYLIRLLETASVLQVKWYLAALRKGEYPAATEYCPEHEIRLICGTSNVPELEVAMLCLAL
jgi:hypothetical protein